MKTLPSILLVLALLSPGIVGAQPRATHRPRPTVTTVPPAGAGAALPAVATTAAHRAPVARELAVGSGAAALHGTFLDAGQAGPAVLIIAGSGPTDRNGDSTVPGVRPATYRLIAAVHHRECCPFSGGLGEAETGLAESAPCVVTLASGGQCSAYADQTQPRNDGEEPGRRKSWG